MLTNENTKNKRVTKAAAAKKVLKKGIRPNQVVKFDEEEVYRGAFHQTIDDAMPVMENALYSLGINLGGSK